MCGAGAETCVSTVVSAVVTLLAAPAVPLQPACEHRPENDRVDVRALIPQPQNRRPDGATGRRRSPIESVLRRPLLAAVPAGVILALLVFPALARSPVHTAEVRLLVGAAAPTEAPERGAVEAHRELAAVYSRMVDTGAHLERVSERLGGRIDAGALAASPVPETPFVRIEASATSADRALEIAEASSAALREQVEELAEASAMRAERSLDDHTEAAADVVEARFERDRLQDRLGEVSNDERSTSAQIARVREALIEAEADLRTAELRTSAAATSFTTGPQASVVALEPFGAPSLAGDDRFAVIQRNAIVGLLLGGLIGTAVATLGANGWRLIDTADEPVVADRQRTDEDTGPGRLRNGNSFHPIGVTSGTVPPRGDLWLPPADGQRGPAPGRASPE